MLGYFQTLREDIDAVMHHDPAARTRLEVVLAYPGLHAVWLHRVAHALWKTDLKLLARLMAHLTRLLTGVEIHPGATLGRRVFMDHGMGVVIGETAVLGDGCLLYQGAVLGGTSTERTLRHPQLGENVVVGAHACILGAIHIGEGARIGSGSVVIRDVPPGATVVGVPGRVMPQKGGVDAHFEATLDHASLPDPVTEVLRYLRRENQRLKSRVGALERQLNLPPTPDEEDTSLVDGVLATNDLPRQHGG